MPQWPLRPTSLPRLHWLFFSNKNLKTASLSIWALFDSCKRASRENLWLNGYHLLPFIHLVGACQFKHRRMKRKVLRSSYLVTLYFPQKLTIHLISINNCGPQFIKISAALMKFPSSFQVHIIKEKIAHMGIPGLQQRLLECRKSLLYCSNKLTIDFQIPSVFNHLFLPTLPTHFSCIK